MLEEEGCNQPLIYLSSGERTKLAHYPSTREPINDNILVVDIHSNYKGYHADIARTFFLSETNAEARKAYRAFIEIVKNTIYKCKPNTSIIDIKKDFYQKLKGLNSGFLMGLLLHGVGILNYELPKIDLLLVKEDTLKL